MIDLVVLCDDCHGLFHGHKTIDYKPPKLKREPKVKISIPLILPHNDVESEMPSGEIIQLTAELIKR